MNRRFYNGRNVARAVSIDELRGMAKRRVPNFCFEYVESGADDEITLNRNREIFNEYSFVPRTLVDISNRSLKIELFGKGRSLPFVIGPTGFNGMLTHQGDLALARAAAAAGIPFSLSNVSNTPLEDIAAVTGEQCWMQVYMYRSREFVRAVADRAAMAGCEALVVTTDVPVYGNREWDARNFRADAKLTYRNMLDTAMHPRWLFDVLVPHGMPRFRNLGDLLPPGQDSAKGASAILARQLDPSLNWNDIAWLRDLWPGILIVKGIISPDDAERAVQIGADGIVLTNHGGRQLDGAVSTLGILPEITARLKGRITLLIDSGFRRGSDIVKALALGADAVLLGRATLYGLAAGGEAGAQRAIDILRSEVDRTMALLGCTDIRTLGSDILHQSSHRLSLNSRTNPGGTA